MSLFKYGFAFCGSVEGLGKCGTISGLKAVKKQGQLKDWVIIVLTSSSRRQGDANRAGVTYRKEAATTQSQLCGHQGASLMSHSERYLFLLVTLRSEYQRGNLKCSWYS